MAGSFILDGRWRSAWDLRNRLARTARSDDAPCGSVERVGTQCLAVLFCVLLLLLAGCAERGDGVDKERAAANRCLAILERTRTGIWEQQPLKTGATPWRVALREVIARDPALSELMSAGVTVKHTSVLLSTNLVAWSDVSGSGTEIAVLLMEPLTNHAGRTFLGIRFNGELVRMGDFP